MSEEPLEASRSPKRARTGSPTGTTVDASEESKADATSVAATKENSDSSTPAEGMGYCMMCREIGLLEPNFSAHKEPDELDEKLDPSIQRKHSVSLLVARPDTNHKGSNDMASQNARGNARGSARNESPTGRPPLQRRQESGRIGVLHAENDYLMREQARLEELWSDQNQGKLYIDSAVKDARIEALKASRTRVSTELARAENERDRQHDRKTTILNLIGRTAMREVEDIVHSTMHISMQDLVRMIHIQVTLRVPPGTHQASGSRARVAGRSLKFDTP